MATLDRRGNSPSELRRMNATAILRALRTSGPLTIAELASAVGLSRPTVVNALEFLAESELIDYHVGGTGSPHRGNGLIGRPAQTVSFRARRNVVVGVELGPSRTVVVLADLCGQVITRRHLGSLTGEDSRQQPDQLAEVVEELLREGGVALTKLAAVVIGLPGIVKPDGRSVRQNHSVPQDFALFTRTISDRLRCDVHIENDVNLAVLGESWQGAAQGASTVAYVHWGTRIGAGLLVGGRLHRGAAGAAGEIGHLVTGFGSATSRNRTTELGAFERDASAPAIAALGRAAALRPDGATLLDLAGGDPQAVQATTVLSAAKAGDPVAMAITEDVVTRFAAGLAPLLLVLDPDLVVLSGGVTLAGTWLLDRLQERLRTYTLEPPRMALSSLRNEAAAIGGIRVALDALENTLLPTETT
ncbi:ROK family protein [Umezawaea sp. NPDC059074]|uniref:ROK family transcriptional regulator n=1 Tax=Umezawaea sp. NPDC059074 TaxID=3346716 RepID=UPI00369CD150